MKLLANIFGAAVGARNRFYDRGILRVDRLQGPVISVGNLSVGGSGKTPFVILMGHLLQSHGVKFDVLSRGYGRRTRGVVLVDPTGAARDFGDEPLLIARSLKIPVVVGESKYQAGLRAEKEFGPQIHLLDDGFQHRRLARDFDIVMVSSEDLYDELLPVGRLREPLSSLGRADAIVISGAISDETQNQKLDGIQRIWRVCRSIEAADLPPRPLVFCGVARPEKFVAQLKERGVVPAAEQFFRDHHTYGDRDIQTLLRLRDAHNAGGLITTEKDAVNLGDHIASLQPLAVVTVTMELQHAANAVDTMLRIVAQRRA